MKIFHIKCSLAILILSFSLSTYAQVSGLSYTISPLAERNWFSDESGLKDGYLAGGQLGFGFGQYVELGANYVQGFNLKTDINSFGFDVPMGMDTMYIPRDINLRRYGGELKLNLSRSALLPYISLGTGIQEISGDSISNNKQIYYSTGIGVKFTAANRYTIGIEGIRTAYSDNPIVTLLNNSDRELFDVDVIGSETQGMAAYALRASLVVYLGGRKPGQLTDLDKAYYDNFSGGFRGLSIPIEPTVMKMNFHEDLSFRDTWMFGGSAGINIGPLVGVRGFYWRAMKDGSATEFDNLSMYGGEARFKLNEGKGFTPWITIGGGQINAGDDYKGNSDEILIEDKPFAMGGLGLDLPFSKYIKLTGYVRSILTTTQSPEDVYQPDDLKNSLSYGASINFVLGGTKKVKKVLMSDQQMLMDSYALTSQAKNDSATAILSRQYDDKIAELEERLAEAVENKDIEAVKEINEQKALAEEVKETIKEFSQPENPQPAVVPTPAPATAPGSIYSPNIMSNPGGSEIRMTPAEFQLLLREILDGVKKNDVGSNIQQGLGNNSQSSSSIDDAMGDFRTEQKLEDLDRAIQDLQSDQKSMAQVQSDLKSNESDIADDLENLLNTYNDKIGDLQKGLDKQNDRYEKLLDNQAEIEAGLKSADGKVVVKSIDSQKLNNEIEDTNNRIDELQSTILEAFGEIKDEIKETNNNIEKSESAGKSDDVNDSKRTNKVNLADKVKSNKEKDEENAYKKDKVDNSEFSNRNNVKASDEYNNREGFFGKLKYNGMSGFAGFGIGGSATFNVGYRLHYAIGDSSKLEFMPETFFGLGSPSSFGLMANVTYALPILKKVEAVKPYIGLGLGLMKVSTDLDEDKLKGAYNFIAGTYLNVWKGDLYVDYTARNLFKYNQLIVGYRFPF